jgi:FkbM family methyltransferase
MLSLYVLAFGVWEPHLSAFIEGRLAPGDVFVDVGANSGWYTLLGSRCVGAGGNVIAVEPSSLIAERLERQLTRNALTNVRVIQEAVSDHVGRVAVELGPAEHIGLTRALRDSVEEASVPCRPLPHMIDSDEWRRIRMIKIDVEGAEFAAVRGLSGRLSALPDTAEVVVEVGPERAQTASDVDQLFSTFQKAGYSGYAIPNKYGVRDYLEYAPIRALPRVEARSVQAELNVVFSRLGGEELPVR